MTVINSGAVAGPYVYDTFTGANGTALTAHTPDIAPVGAAWDNANVEIQGNLATLKGAADRQLSSIQSNVSDCVIEANISYGTATQTTSNAYAHGIVFRYVDASNYWIYSFIPRSDNMGIALWEVTTTATVRAQAIPSLVCVPGTVYSFKVTINGTGITGTINGVNQLTYTSAQHQTATKHGFKLGYINSGTNATCDNFKVSPL